MAFLPSSTGNAHPSSIASSFNRGMDRVAQRGKSSPSIQGRTRSYFQNLWVALLVVGGLYWLSLCLRIGGLLPYSGTSLYQLPEGNYSRRLDFQPFKSISISQPCFEYPDALNCKNYRLPRTKHISDASTRALQADPFVVPSRDTNDTLQLDDGRQSSREGSKTLKQSFQGRSIFERDMEDMVSTFKVFVYPHASNDPFTNIFEPLKSRPGGNYASESFFKKALYESNFITTNASEAHIFFLPFSITFLRYDKRVGVEGLEPFVKTYIAKIKQEWPYWNRTDGADHFFVSCHSITRTVVEKVEELQHNVMQLVCSSNSFRQAYVPHKDVSLPQIWPRNDVHPEAKLVAQRTKLGFFAGEANSEVRSSLVKAWSNDSELSVHSGRIPTPYADALLTTKYCLHVRGFEVNTARLADAFYYGCVPVIIADDYDLPFQDILPWHDFSVVLSQFDIPLLKTILLQISHERYLALHKNVIRVRHHFRWNSPPRHYDAFYMIMYELWLRRHVLRFQL